MYQLSIRQHIPASINDVWDFISSPRNLQRITPKDMAFEITNEPIADTMYAGMIIMYRVRPLLGIRMQWVTEITHVQERAYFVDEQRIGPYALWHHEHHVREITGGVEMHDIITYRPPFGLLGRIANAIIIKRQLDAIFAYRRQALIEVFGRFEGGEPVHTSLQPKTLIHKQVTLQ